MLHKKKIVYCKLLKTEDNYKFQTENNKLKHGREENILVDIKVRNVYGELGKHRLPGHVY